MDAVEGARIMRQMRKCFSGTLKGDAGVGLKTRPDLNDVFRFVGV